MNAYKSVLLGAAVFALNACGAAESSDGVDTEADVEIGTLDQAIFNGNTNWSGKNQIRYRTVSIYDHNAGGSFVGSGTMLRPNLLLTGRYLVTTNGLANGPLNTPSNVRVRIGNLAPAPGGSDICTGANRQPDCAVGSTVLWSSSTANLAVVRLANSLSHSSMKVPFTPVLAEFTDASVDGDDVLVTGWGQTACAGGAMSLAWGTMEADVNGNWINLVETAGAQEASPGDNGGPTWANLAGYPQIGVHSSISATCPASTNVDSSLILSANRSAIESVLDSESVNINTPLSNLNEVDFENASGAAPNWVIAGGKLKQNSNTGPSFALIKNAVEFHRIDFEAQVTINSTDDDKAGIVFHYSDPDNHVLCRADDQNNVLELVTRRFGVDIVQDSVAWTGVFSNLVVRAEGSDEQARTTRCRFSGGGLVGSTVLSYTNGDGPYGGRIGVYSDFNNGATFNNFTSVH